MHVGVVHPFVVVDRRDHALRPLRGSRAVEEYQRLAVHLAREDREVAPHALHVVDACDIGFCTHGFPSNPSRADTSLSCAAMSVSISARNSSAVDARYRVFDERPLQQRLRRAAVDAARQQVEQHLLVELAGGGAVLRAHAIGVDLELRPHRCFRTVAGEQRLQRLLGIGAVRRLAHHHLAVEAELAAIGGDAAIQLARHRVGAGVIDFGEHVVRLDAVRDAGGGELATRGAAGEFDEDGGARGEAAERDGAQSIGCAFADVRASACRSRSRRRRGSAGGSDRCSHPRATRDRRRH